MHDSTCTISPATTESRRSLSLDRARVDGIEETHAQHGREIQTRYVTGTLRALYIGLAGISFVLAMIGVVLPGLPTTPFLLLTSYLLARSWPRMHHALRANRYVGPILHQWEEHRALDLRIKVRAAATIMLFILLLVLFSGWPLLRVACVAACSSIGLIVIYRLPTLKENY